MQKPLISLIIPVHNSERFIAECLDSVVRQTYPNLEVIIVDDDSMDKTAEIVATYVSKHKEFIYTKTQNKNAAKTRRDGVKKASADLICFVDSDDILDEQYVELLYQAMETTKTDISACNIETFSGDNKLPKNKKYSKPYTVESNARSFVDHYHITDKNKLTLQTMPCKLFKKNLFDGIDYSVLKTNIFEDNFIMVQILRKVKKIGIVGGVLYWYRQDTGSVSAGTVFSTVKYDGKKLNSIEFFKEVVAEYCKKMLPGPNVEGAVDKLCSREFFNYARMVPNLKVRNEYLEQKAKLDGEHHAAKITEKDQQIAALLNSKSYKIGHALVDPVSKIVNGNKHRN